MSEHSSLPSGPELRSREDDLSQVASRVRKCKGVSSSVQHRPQGTGNSIKEEEIKAEEMKAEGENVASLGSSRRGWCPGGHRPACCGASQFKVWSTLPRVQWWSHLQEGAQLSSRGHWPSGYSTPPLFLFHEVYKIFLHPVLPWTLCKTLILMWHLHLSNLL